MLTLYVAPNGRDTACGHAADPFSSITAAQCAVRELVAGGLREPVTVSIAAGTYRTNGLVFTEADSGAADCPITYEAAGDVTVCGSLTLEACDFTSLTPDEAARLHGDAPLHVRRIDLKNLGLTAADWGGICTIGSYNTAKKYDDAFTSPLWCELFFNGERMEPARYPDEGFVRLGKPYIAVENETEAERFARLNVPNPPGERYHIDEELAQRLGSWKSIRDVWMFGYPLYDWADASAPLAEVDADKCELATGHASLFGVRDRTPCYFFNVFEELDRPGEWYLDRDTGILYLYAPAELSTASIELSLLTTPLVRFENASHLTLRGIRFTGTRSDALVLTGHDNRIENCIVRNIAGNAIVIEGENCTVTGCEISHTGCGGVRIHGGDRQTLTSSGNAVTQNHIHHIAQITRTYQPGVFLGGVGCLCAHNCIHDSAHMAIGFSGNFHIMEYNEIYEVCQIADDSGAIYSGRDYTTCGNVIRCNFFHDMSSDADSHIGIFGVYCDDNLGSCTIERNVFLRCQSALLLHGGHDMCFENNLIIDSCPKSQYSIRFHRYCYWRELLENGTHWSHLNKLPWRSEVWKAASPHLEEYLSWDPETVQAKPHYCSISGNIIVRHKPIDVLNFNCFEPELHNRVQDNYAVLDYEHAGITFTPAFGFDNAVLRTIVPDWQDIPFDKIGLGC